MVHNKFKYKNAIHFTFTCVFVLYRKWDIHRVQAGGSMAEVNVLLSCGNDDKTLKIERDCTFDEFRTQVKSLFPHLPEVSQFETFLQQGSWLL